MSRIWALVVMVMSVGMVGQAWGTDCLGLPEDHRFYDTDCGGVCYSCNSGEVCCDGTNGTADDIIILVELAGSPYVYGVLDDGEAGETEFCCDSDDFTETSAVDVEIWADGGDDVICLQDSSRGSCLNEVDGVQVWGAAATIYGENGLDEIYTCPSSSYDDYVDGGNDKDIIETFDGTDTVYGQGGDDIIRVGDGDDTVEGGDGDDVIAGGSGIDTLDGGINADIINGDSGDDVIRGGNHGDELYGGIDADHVVGDLGVDYVGGNAGDDCLCGGSNGTGANADSSLDTINGDADTDTCYWMTSEGESPSNCEGGLSTANCPCAP